MSRGTVASAFRGKEMTRPRARDRRREIGGYFLGVWGLLVLFGTIFDDVGIQPEGWAWDALMIALSVLWFVLIGVWVWAFVRQRRSRRDPEEELATFLGHFAGWEKKLAQRDRQLAHVELRLDEDDQNPELVVFVCQRGIPGERQVRWPLQRDGQVRDGKTVSKELGLYLDQLTSAEWDGLERSYRTRVPASDPA